MVLSTRFSLRNLGVLSVALASLAVLAAAAGCGSTYNPPPARQEVMNSLQKQIDAVDQNKNWTDAQKAARKQYLQKSLEEAKTRKDLPGN